MKKLFSFVMTVLIIGQLGFTVPVFSESNQKNFFNPEIAEGEIVISRKIIEQSNDGTYVVETISMKESTQEPILSLDAASNGASGTTTITKSESYYSQSVLQGTASLTVTFAFNEENSYISYSDVLTGYYVPSGSYTYFTNKNLSNSSFGGFLFAKPSKTVTMSYQYGLFSNSGSISLTCNTAGEIS